MPIRFFYQKNFKVRYPRKTAAWIKNVAARERKTIGEIAYVFCSDEYLLDLNERFLNHKTLTDIISFDYSKGQVLSGEIYISVDRVRENSVEFQSDFDEENRRVIVHGILHFCGYKDKTEVEKITMRKKEEACLSLWKRMFHVKR